MLGDAAVTVLFAVMFLITAQFTGLDHTNLVASAALLLAVRAWRREKE